MSAKAVSLGLSSAPDGGGFFAASSWSNNSNLSRAEGAAQRQFRCSARQVLFFDAPSLQLPLFSDFGIPKYPSAVKGLSAYDRAEYPTAPKGQSSVRVLCNTRTFANRLADYAD